MQPPSLSSVLPKASPSVGTSFSPVFPILKILYYIEFKRAAIGNNEKYLNEKY